MVIKMVWNKYFMDICGVPSLYRQHEPCRNKASYICSKCGKQRCERHMKGKNGRVKQNLEICLLCRDKE